MEDARWRQKDKFRPLCRKPISNSQACTAEGLMRATELACHSAEVANPVARCVLFLKALVALQLLLHGNIYSFLYPLKYTIVGLFFVILTVV